MKFTDNVLVDVPGPDLYIFEIGPDTEPMHLAISADGKSWVDIGNVGGGTAEVDIAKFVKRADVFRCVRITDLKSACGGAWPGAVLKPAEGRAASRRGADPVHAEGQRRDPGTYRQRRKRRGERKALARARGIGPRAPGEGREDRVASDRIE